LKGVQRETSFCSRQRNSLLHPATCRGLLSSYGKRTVSGFDCDHRNPFS